MFWLLPDCFIDLFLFTNEICELKEDEGGVQIQTDLFFFFFRSGVLKEYMSAGHRSAQRRNRTCSDSSVYDTECQ